jgi:hypothetical protein
VMNVNSHNCLICVDKSVSSLIGMVRGIILCGIVEYYE